MQNRADLQKLKISFLYAETVFRVRQELKKLLKLPAPIQRIGILKPKQ